MAKISARGAYELATLNGTKIIRNNEVALDHVDTWPVRLVLRSDGVVLIRNRGERMYEGSSYRSGASGYKTLARFDKAVFPGLLEKYGAEKILRNVAKNTNVVADDVR